MRLGNGFAERIEPNWRECLFVAFDGGALSFLNVEWLIDAVEREEWSGLWW